MITFHCESCRRAFSVPDHYAGRQAKCACGHVLTVPACSAPAAAAPSLRTRRLTADEKELRELLCGGEPTLATIVSTVGSPPEKYVIEYRVRGLLERKPEVYDTIDTHRVEIILTSEYPRVGPMCRMLTPIFHPNIDESSICIGDHWTAGERLGDLVVRIAEMIAYQAYNIRSPLNAVAAMWADLNPDKLPVDKRDLRQLLGK